MRSLITLLLSSFLLLNPATIAQNLQRGVGRIIQPKKELNLPYKYYVTLQKSDGTVLAFPVRSKDVDLKKLKKKELHLITFTTEAKKLTLGETTQDITIMNLLTAKYLTMKELGTMGISTDNIEKNVVSKKGQAKQGLRINDKLTNSIIFTAGALLLGSMIAD